MGTCSPTPWINTTACFFGVPMLKSFFSEKKKGAVNLGTAEGGHVARSNLLARSSECWQGKPAFAKATAWQGG